MLRSRIKTLQQNTDVFRKLKHNSKFLTALRSKCGKVNENYNSQATLHFLTAALFAATSFLYQRLEIDNSCQICQCDSRWRDVPTPPSPPVNVTAHRMRSIRARNLSDKYKVDWKTVLGEGAYGSVHPARLAATGEKV